MVSNQVLRLFKNKGGKLIPETRGKSNLKYDFESMRIEEYEVKETYSEAMSMASAAWRRGYQIAIRTIDGEIRCYFMGKRQ